MPVNLDEKSDAFYRRMLSIEVMQKGKEIPNLKEGLACSMPGFIRECAAALTRLYTTRREIDSPNSKRLVHEYHRESDNVQAFLDDRIKRTSGERIERTELYKLYESYCIFNQWTPLSSRGFYKNLRGKGYRDYMSSGSRYFSDMCTKSALSEHERADFRQATFEENAVFAENNSK